VAWNWVEYVHVAGSWVPSTFTTPRDQALVRSIVSRAYYAAFNPAKAYALQKGWIHPGRKKIAHGDVWTSFQYRDRTQAERDIGDTGQALMDDRQEADYEISFGCAKKVCDDAIRRANEILTWLKAPPAQPPKPPPPPTPPGGTGVPRTPKGY